MTTISFRPLSFALLLVLLVSGCGSRQGSPAMLGPDVLFERGMTAFEQEKYSRAIESLETFLQSHIGDPRAPRARLTLGRARMEKKDYILAAADFTRLLNDFPSDTLARPARFGICEAYQRLSPKPPLDQEYTGAAIAHCQAFVEIYPGTPEAAQAAEWAGELTRRLALKAYNTGMFYFKRGAYDAAVIYFADAVEQFPGTEIAPAALQKMVESYRAVGYEEEAEEARARLLRDYPQSAEARALQTDAPASGG